MSLASLYMEELRAVPRGRFALAGAALLMAFVTFCAAIPGTEDSEMEAYFVMVCLFIPTGFAALAALPLATARSTRFIQSVFTAPVKKGEYLAAKVLVTLTLGFAYLLSLIPFILVYASQIGWPEAAGKWLFVATGLVVYSTALGTFLSVVFTGRSTAAPAVLGVAFMFLSLIGVVFLWIVLDGNYSPGMKEFLVRLVHLGPHASLVDTVDLHNGVDPETPYQSLLAYLVSVVGLFIASAWIFLREQGIETWEVAPSRRGLVAALVVAVFLAPTLVTGTAYAQASDSEEGSFHEIFRPSNGLWVRLVERGAPTLTAGFGGMGGIWEDHLAIGETRELDLLVLFPAKPGTTLTNVHLRLGSTPTLNLEAPGSVTMAQFTSTEAGLIPKPGFGDAPDPATSERGSVLRIPVKVRPEAPEAPGDTFYAVNVTATYHAPGLQDAQDGFGHTHVRAEIPGAALQMTAAGIPLLLACAIPAIRRKLRVG